MNYNDNGKNTNALYATFRFFFVEKNIKLFNEVLLLFIFKCSQLFAYFLIEKKGI
jgi:hypothetical protein